MPPMLACPLDAESLQLFAFLAGLFHVPDKDGGMNTRFHSLRCDRRHTFALLAFRWRYINT